MSSNNFIKFDGKFNLPICELDPDKINLQHLNLQELGAEDSARLVLKIQKDNGSYVGFPFKAFVESVGNEIMNNRRIKNADLEILDKFDKGALNLIVLFEATVLGQGFKYLIDGGFIKKELIDGEDYYFPTHSLFGENFAQA